MGGSEIKKFMLPAAARPEKNDGKDFQSFSFILFYYKLFMIAPKIFSISLSVNGKSRL
jgi:hypothetical protein